MTRTPTALSRRSDSVTGRTHTRQADRGRATVDKSGMGRAALACIAFPAKVGEREFKAAAVRTCDRGQRILEENRTSLRMDRFAGPGAGSNCPITHARDGREGLLFPRVRRVGLLTAADSGDVEGVRSGRGVRWFDAEALPLQVQALSRES